MQTCSIEHRLTNQKANISRQYAADRDLVISGPVDFIHYGDELADVLDVAILKDSSYRPSWF